MSKPGVAAATATQATAPVAAGVPSQYLTFSLAGETFAIGILGIKEIIEYRKPTEVPMSPPAVCGVINLRGAVVAVVDPQARFGRPPSPVGKRTCIVIVEVAQGDERQVIGVQVDAVHEVLEIAAGEIEPTPSFGTRVPGEFIAGIGKVQGRFVILLDVDRVLAGDEVAAVTALAH